MSDRSQARPQRSLPVKITTLFFSGGVASLAILHAGPCDPAPPPPTVEAPRPTNEAAATPTASATPTPTPTPTVTASATPTPTPTPEAPTPAAETERVAPQAARYLGGSKSDIDVWGIDTAVPSEPTPTKEPATNKKAGKQ